MSYVIVEIHSSPTATILLGMSLILNRLSVFFEVKYFKIYSKYLHSHDCHV